MDTKKGGNDITRDLKCREYDRSLFNAMNEITALNINYNSLTQSELSQRNHLRRKKKVCLKSNKVRTLRKIYVLSNAMPRVHLRWHDSFAKPLYPYGIITSV